MNEFEVIQAFFAQRVVQRPEVVLGIGDDAALVKVPSDQEVAMTVDTLVAGVHFPLETPPEAIGYKALAVNLSDLAAMGAQPAWMMLALTLPEADPTWLLRFGEGLFELADTFHLPLIGGDTTRGPLSITIQVCGLLPSGQALRRQGARAGDRIYVSGPLGGAGLGLKLLGGHPHSLSPVLVQEAFEKLCRPFPRVAVGVALRTIATSAIDISDGLLADLTHILQASQLNAKIYSHQVPLFPGLQCLSPEEAFQLALTAGDDYELCFSVPPEKERVLLTLEGSSSFRCIGTLVDPETVPTLYVDDQPYQGKLGFQHFDAHRQGNRV